MPRRKDPLITGQFYHIYNRSIDNRKVFDDESMAAHFLFALRYYRSNSIDRSLSKYKILDPSLQQVLLSQINDPTTFRIDILAYCLMPNHMHLLAKQRKDDGITITLSNVLNSFTRHYNSLHSRKGPIFLPRFRAKHIK